jgi:hypothetical protein
MQCSVVLAGRGYTLWRVALGGECGFIYCLLSLFLILYYTTLSAPPPHTHTSTPSHTHTTPPHTMSSPHPPPTNIYTLIIIFGYLCNVRVCVIRDVICTHLVLNQCSCPGGGGGADGTAPSLPSSLWNSCRTTCDNHATLDYLPTNDSGVSPHTSQISHLLLYPTLWLLVPGLSSQFQELTTSIPFGNPCHINVCTVGTCIGYVNPWWGEGWRSYASYLCMLFRNFQLQPYWNMNHNTIPILWDLLPALYYMLPIHPPTHPPHTPVHVQSRPSLFSQLFNVAHGD